MNKIQCENCNRRFDKDTMCFMPLLNGHYFEDGENKYFCSTCYIKKFKEEFEMEYNINKR